MIYKLLITGLVGLIFLSGCDNLPDEQFEKYVLFARNGLVDHEFEYHSDSSITTNLSVSVSGTSALNHDISVTIEEDIDTLEIYNETTFGDETDDYYTVLPDSCYSFNSREGIIYAGDEYGLIPLQIVGEKVNKYKQHVLPLRIVGTSDYAIAPSPADVLLLKVSFTNKYSGDYVFSGTLDGASVAGDFTLNVLDENKCYFYLNYEGDDENTYPPVIIRFNTDMSLTLSVRPADGITLEQVDTDTDGEVTNLYEENKEKLTRTIILGFSYIDQESQEERTFFGQLITTLQEENN